MKQTTSRFLALVIFGSAFHFTGNAQTAADFMTAMKSPNSVVPFDIDAVGEEYKVNWGMDAAWDWDYNVKSGIAHISKDNFATGRVSFQPVDVVIDNGDGTYSLTERQKKKLKWRCELILSTGTTKTNINCDHEALFYKVDENGNYPESGGKKIKDYTGRTNYQGKPEEWYKLIKASVAFVKEQGLEVVSVSPFNEPDYVWEQATSESQAMADFLAIAQLIKADPYFDGIRVCGGNTLNDDRALPWYEYLADYLDEGNTHQLAGSFDNYANFFTTVRAAGKQAAADELHNVGEAIVGVNYGMQNGIWWGFDSRARGQFCDDSNEGVRIGYGESRDTWTNAAVYRNEKTGEVHGYFGSSERQAAAATFQYVSTTRDVYFNGYGPTRSFIYNVPGWTGGYQFGQINAERLFEVNWGEDVPPAVIDGTYQIVNAYSNKMLTCNTTSNVTSVTRKTSGTSQQWKVNPVYVDFKGERKKDAEGKDYISYGEGVSGDVSYWFIDNNNTSAEYHLNVLNNNLNAGAGVIGYNAGHGKNEQWYVKYAKDGYFYIISRLSNKYLYCSSSSSGANINLQNPPADNISAGNLKKYLWRFQPIDSKSDVRAPSAPVDLMARQRPGSIQLSWTAPSDSDPLTYIVLRNDGNGWNTIGRNISGTTFTDNTVVPGESYQYKLKSVDYAGNRSADSFVLDAAPIDDTALLCQLQLDSDLSDQTANQLFASSYPEAKFSSLTTFHKSGSAGLNLSSQNSYLQIPYALTHQTAMTIAMWVRWSGGSNWQRIFDFGNDTEHYMFLTPSTGSEMRFVMKNGSDEQILSTGKLATNTFKHIALTFTPAEGGNTSVTLYIDGEPVATKSDFTISPADIASSLAYIGRSQFISDPLFKGYIDDFRIYNTPLSTEKIASMMTDLGETSTDVIDDYVDTVPTAISNPAADTDGFSSSAPFFNAAGQQVPADYRGVIMQKGVKRLNR